MFNILLFLSKRKEIQGKQEQNMQLCFIGALPESCPGLPETWGPGKAPAIPQQRPGKPPTTPDYYLPETVLYLPWIQMKRINVIMGSPKGSRTLSQKWGKNGLYYTVMAELFFF